MLKEREPVRFFKFYPLVGAVRCENRKTITVHIGKLYTRERNAAQHHNIGRFFPRENHAR